MAQKYIEASGGTNFDRIQYAGSAIVHLSDGTLAYIVQDASQTNWLLRYTTDHSATTTIASWAKSSTSNPVVNGTTPLSYQSLTLCRDSSDNIYVVGQSSGGGYIAVQAYVKGAGYTWTQQTTMTYNSGLQFYSLSSVWCNTGGGTNSKGHLMVIFGYTAPNWGYATLDAGVALAGTGAVMVNIAGGVTFLGNGNGGPASNESGSNLDLSSDGFGATSGVAACNSPNSNTSIGVGAWAINSAGALTTNTFISSITTGIGTLGAATRIRLVRAAPNKWALVVPSATTPNGYAIATLSNTAIITALTDAGAPTNLPLMSNNTGWDAFSDPTRPNIVWLIAQTNGAATVYAMQADVSTGVGWGSVPKLLDTWSPFNTGGFYGLRVVKQPVVSTFIDYQSDIATSNIPNYALAGSYTTASFLSTILAGQKYAEFSGGTTLDHIAYCGNAIVQLSDGTLVFLVRDQNTGKFYLRYTTNRSTVYTIASWQTNSGTSPVTYNSSYQDVTLCRDASDNIYVVGAMNLGYLGVQAYVKGAGYTWTQKTMLTYNPGQPASSFSAVWCNTGGGNNSKGHLMVVYGINQTTPTWDYTICDAGAALAGTGTLQTANATNPTFFGNGFSPYTTGIMNGGNLDISPDGFGATSGLATANSNALATSASVGTWAINSSGALTTNTNIITYSGLGTMTATTKIRLVRYAPNSWALVTPSGGIAGAYSMALLTKTTYSAMAESYSPTNMPKVSANQGWDVLNDPSTPNRVWLILQDGSANVYAEAASVASAVTWATSATIQDTFSTYYAVSLYDLRVVKQPVVSTYVDYQSFIETDSSTYALLGDYTTFALPVLGRRGFNANIKGRRGRGVLTSF